MPRPNVGKRTDGSILTSDYRRHLVNGYAKETGKGLTVIVIPGNLQYGINQIPRIQQPVYGFADGGGGTKNVCVAEIMQIGAEQAHISLFDKVLGQFQLLFTIIAAKRQQVELETAVHIVQFVVEFLVRPKIQVALGMCYNWLIIFYL